MNQFQKLVDLMDIPLDPTLAFLATSALIKYGISMSWSNKKPKNAKLVGKVSGLHFHPIKSCGTIEIDEAECTFTGMYSQGFADRGFIVTRRLGSEWKMVTARPEPSIELIKPSIHGDFLHLDAPEMKTLKLSRKIAIKDGEIGSTKVWGESISGVDCGPEASEWLKTYLKKDEDYHLLYHNSDLPKRELENGLMSKYQTVAKEDDKIMYQDVAPFLLCSQQSLDDLNQKTSTNITMKHFRPNIIVDECEKPFVEDSWDEIWIGDGKYTKLFLCDRCMMTTVNPETGVQEPNKEPKSTLEKYRTIIQGASPMFGVTLVANRSATIKVGDPVYATRTEKIIVGNTGITVDV